MSVDDVVRLEVDGREVVIAESYDIHASVLEQPATFSLKLGHGKVVRNLIAEFTPNLRFRLTINGILQQTGALDGVRAEASSGGTGITVFGRDALAPLHDGRVAVEKSFTDATYADLVKSALEQVGLDPKRLVGSGAADRKLRSGVPIGELLPVRVVEEIIAAAKVEGVIGPDGKTEVAAVHQVLQCKASERWYEFVRRHIDRAGLFLWASGDGHFILSAPQTKQEPAYSIKRSGDQVISADYLIDTRQRFSRVVTFARGGGRKHGLRKAKGVHNDEEMIGWGFKRDFVVRDTNSQNDASAAYLSARKLAESRRAGWQLVYTVAGHSTWSYFGKEAVWIPDTMVDVHDDEFGINDKFWLDSVDYRRGAQGTTTTLRLMRPEDLIFGGGDE